MPLTNMQTLLAAVDLTTVKQLKLTLADTEVSTVTIKKPKDGAIVVYEETAEVATTDALGNVTKTVDTTHLIDFDVKYNKA